MFEIFKEERNKADALRIREQYLADIKYASIEQKNVKTKLDQSMKKLLSRKLAILKYSIYPFVDLYETFKKINFHTSDGIEELDHFEINLLKEQKVKSMDLPNFSVSTKDFSSQELAILLTGVFIGMPIAGVVVAALNVSARESKQKLDRAILESEQADLFIEKLKVNQKNCEALIYTIEKCTQTITELNKLFVRSQMNASQVITKNGVDKSHYSEDERRQLAVWINLAKAIKDLLDIPILGADGLINTMMIDALDKNEKVLEELS